MLEVGTSRHRVLAISIQLQCGLPSVLLQEVILRFSFWHGGYGGVVVCLWEFFLFVIVFCLSVVLLVVFLFRTPCLIMR